MLAQRLPSILPPLAPKELLEVSMIASVAGELGEGKLTDRRPFRARTIRLRWRRWSAAVCACDRARPRLPITACCSSTNSPNSPELCSSQVRLLHNSGILAAGARCATPAAGDRRLHDRPRQSPRHLSGAHPAGRGDEPEPLRHGRRAWLSLPARRALPHRLSGADIRPAARSNRSQDRGAGGLGQRSDPAGPGGEECRCGAACGARTDDPARTFRAARRHLRHHELALLALPHRGDRDSGCIRPVAAQGCRTTGC